jgi:hypothetical protein
VHPWYNGGIVQLTSLTSNVTGGAVQNYGTIQGLGAVSCELINMGGVEASGGTLALAGATANASAGTLTVDNGSKLVITAGLATNAGTIVNQGGIFDNNSFALDNTGVITGFGTFRTGSTGLTNNGGITFTGGPTTVVGPVTNQNGRTITVAYNPAVFAGLVINNGGATLDTISTTVTFAGGFTNSAGSHFVKAGSGELDEPIAPTLDAGSSLTVVGGTMRFNVVGTAVIGTGVTVTVNSGAMLELAGSISGLGDGASRANVLNNSSAPGVLISGTEQYVGTIDGSGTVQINAGSGLTANHLIQSALLIGGTSTSHGLLAIDASDASGNPLQTSSGLELAGSLVYGDQFVDCMPVSGGVPSSELSLGLELGSSTPSGGSPAVPEPSAIALVLTGGTLLAVARHLSRQRTAESSGVVRF